MAALLLQLDAKTHFEGSITMVQSYKRKTSTKYSTKALLTAVTAVKKQGMKRFDSHNFNVSATTIFGHISGRYSRINILEQEGRPFCQKHSFV